MCQRMMTTYTISSCYIPIHFHSLKENLSVVETKDYCMTNKKMTLIFTIYGNQENEGENPIPCLRTTQGTQWTPQAIRYKEWKSFVVAQLIDLMQAMPREERMQYVEVIDLIGKKPIKATKNKIVMDLMIYFKDQSHADCDNIFKGIADALFMNDKYLAGSFDYKMAEQGKVDITIKFI
jgi:hypothetical protein